MEAYTPSEYSERTVAQSRVMLFSDLVTGARSRVTRETDLDWSGDNSPCKKYYGDAWTFICGIKQGYSTIGRKCANRTYKYDASKGTMTCTEETYDMSPFEELADEYGYGAYGEGLKLSRQLYFHEPDTFEFSESNDNTGDELTFEFSE